MFPDRSPDHAITERNNSHLEDPNPMLTHVLISAVKRQWDRDRLATPARIAGVDFPPEGQPHLGSPRWPTTKGR
jgi:hypothetical protein